MEKSGEKWEKLGKTGENWEKVGKSAKSGENGRRRSFWMTENHFRSHFSPFQIHTPLFCFELLPKSIGTSLYSMLVATLNMMLIGAFLIKL